jgi:serine/threonine protein phosphatase 1
MGLPNFKIAPLEWSQHGAAKVFGSIRKALGRRAPAEIEGPISVSPALAYAVGDVHGRLDCLDGLLKDIAADAAATREPATLVFLGDLVDRGPESAGVVERVCALRRSGDWAAVESILGNHEEAMLLFLEDAAFGPTWMKHGGGPTLASYGVAPPDGPEPEAWEPVQAAFRAALPADHLELIATSKPSLLWGDYVFVHAGLRPGVPLASQDPHDLRWIRAEFLTSHRPFEKVVVHGHTPSEEPEFKPWRIGLDTGAYATGVLTAVKLHGVERRILQGRPAQR